MSTASRTAHPGPEAGPSGARTLLKYLHYALSRAYWKPRLAGYGRLSYLPLNAHLIGSDQLRIGARTSIGDHFHAVVNRRTAGEVAIEIGSHCYVARRNFLSAGRRILIEDYVMTGVNNALLGSHHDYADPTVAYVNAPTTSDATITIQVNALLSANVTVVGSVTIGYGAVIGAGSLVVNDIPPLSLAFGSPAAVTRRYSWHRRRWLAADCFTDDDERSLPGRTEYAALVAARGPVSIPFTGNSRSFGNR